MRYFITISSITLLLSLLGCENFEEVVPLADLEVYVTGTFSGNPRENISVTLFLTKEDAEDEINAISNTQKTNIDGITIFYELDGNRRYWVRAAPFLTRTIRETSSLREGLNSFSISVL